MIVVINRVSLELTIQLRSAILNKFFSELPFTWLQVTIFYEFQNLSSFFCLINFLVYAT